VLAVCYSGGTVVTVYGRYLNSVFSPRIILRVDVTRFINNVTSVTDDFSQSEVINVELHVHLFSLMPVSHRAYGLYGQVTVETVGGFDLRLLALYKYLIDIDIDIDERKGVKSHLTLAWNNRP